jgi:hypothetical protein
MREKGGSLLYLYSLWFSGSCCGFLACRHAWGLHALSVISFLIRDIHGTRGVHVLTDSSPKLGNAVVEIYRIQQFSTDTIKCEKAIQLLIKARGSSRGNTGLTPHF